MRRHIVFLFQIISFLTLLLTIPLTLTAEESSPFKNGFSSYEGIPSLIVNGVNVITGEYIYTEPDVVLNTPVPLSLIRSYNSKVCGYSPVSHQWSHSQQRYAETWDWINDGIFTTHEGARGSIQYSYKQGYKDIAVHPRLYVWGLTNAAYGVLGGAYDPLNVCAIPQGNGEVCIITGDGLQRFYGWTPTMPKGQFPKTMVLKKERLPSGHWIEYTYATPKKYRVEKTEEYDDYLLPTEIILKDPSCNRALGWIRLAYNADLTKVETTSSDEDSVVCNYRLAPKDNKRQPLQRFLDKSTSTFSVPVTYKYKDHKEMGHPLEKIERPEGRYLMFVHYDGGSIRRERVQGFHYGSIYQQKSPIGKDGAPITIYKFIYKTKYKQTNFHDGSVRFDLKGGVTYVHDAYGNVIDYEYNKDHCLTRILTKFGLDRVYKVEQNDLKGVTFRKSTRYTLRQTAPALGLPEKIEELFRDPKTGQMQLLRYTKKTYLPRGLVAKEELYDSAHQLLRSTSTSYNSLGLPTRIETLGGVTLCDYDANGNATRKIDPLGNETHMQYDLADRLIAETVVDKITGEALTKRFAYDYKNNCTSITDAYGNVTEIGYDPLSRKICETRPAISGIDGKPFLHKKQFSYDVLNNKTEEYFEKDPHTVTSYTLHGSPFKITYPDGTEESFRYHPWGALKSKKERNGALKEYTTDYLNRIVKEEIYTADRQLLDWTEYIYNAFYLLSKKERSGRQELYEYDGAGRQIALSVLDAKGTLLSKKTMAYDALDRVVKEVEYADLNSGSATVTFTSYNNKGLPSEKRIETNKGELISYVRYSYDALGRAIEEQAETASGTALTSRSYNGRGELLKTIDPLGAVTTFSYNRKAKNSLGQYVLEKTEKDPLGRTTTTFYDSWGRAQDIVRKDSKDVVTSRVINSYDAYNNKIKETHHVFLNGEKLREYTCLLTYDAENHLTSIMRAAGTSEEQFTAYSYQAGQLKTTTKPDGVTLDYSYTPLGLVKRLSSSDGTIDYLYTYDLARYPICIEDVVHKTKTLRTYDLSGRVIEEKLDTGLVLKKHYDLQGKLLSLELPDGAQLHWEYAGPLLKQVQLHGASGQQLHTYRYLQYHPNGLAASESWGQGSLEHAYDKLNRLTNSTVKSAENLRYSAQMLYDAVGNCIALTQKDAAKTRNTTYAYVHNNPLTHFDPFGLAAEEIRQSVFWSGVRNTMQSGWSWTRGTYRQSMDYLSHVNWQRHCLTAIDAVDQASLVGGTLLALAPHPMAKALGAAVIPFRKYALASARMHVERFFARNVARENLSIASAKTASIGERSLGVIKPRIFDIKQSLNLDTLSKAGSIPDRGGLTRAGRALDKHGNRLNSVFPKATGSTHDKNMQGQFHLDDILTHPKSYSKPNRFGGVDYFRPDGSGARFYRDGQFRGFLEPDL